MASQFQQVIYEGYLTADPDEMRYTGAGQAVVSFRMGSNKEYKNRAGEKIKETTWLRVTCWAGLAETVARFCKKGTHVLVSGTLTSEDGNPKVFQRKDGSWGSSFEITARDMRIFNPTFEDNNDDFGDDSLPFA